jgi:hypothetical protein
VIKKWKFGLHLIGLLSFKVVDFSSNEESVYLVFCYLSVILSWTHAGRKAPRSLQAKSQAIHYFRVYITTRNIRLHASFLLAEKCEHGAGLARN